MTEVPTEEALRLFERRALDYQRSRSRYPEALFDWLAAASGLGPGAEVADIGSGTGITTGSLLARGYRVHAVEPNQEMRRVAESLFAGREGFFSVAGQAEATGLADHSVELVVATQSFHYFDQPRARAEFDRILRPGGRVLVCWNGFDPGSPAYPDFIALQRRHAVTPGRVRLHDYFREQGLAAFFGPGGWTATVLHHQQALSPAALEGLLFSLSYMPDRDDPGAAALCADVHRLIDRHGQNGDFILHYRLEAYLSQP